jgi:hypothetical protein
MIVIICRSKQLLPSNVPVYESERLLSAVASTSRSRSLAVADEMTNGEFSSASACLVKQSSRYHRTPATVNNPADKGTVWLWKGELAGSRQCQGETELQQEQRSQWKRSVKSLLAGASGYGLS